MNAELARTHSSPSRRLLGVRPPWRSAPAAAWRPRPPRPLRQRRLPQPHHLLGRLDLDAEAGEEGHRQAGHPLGPGLVRAGRPRRQRQPQLHAGRRRLAGPRRPTRSCKGRARRRPGPRSIGAATIKGDNGGVGGNGNMWRWQSIQEFQYPLLEYLSVAEEPAAVHRHGIGGGRAMSTRSMSIVTGQMPNGHRCRALPASGSFAALGNADALAQWSYCFDRGDTDTQPWQRHRPPTWATTGTARSRAATARPT